MSTDNVINHELLVKMNELMTDPRDYAKSLAYYVDHKSSILRELRDRLVSILKGGILYVDEDAKVIDENILPKEMWYTPIKATVVSVNGVDYNGDSTVLMHAKVVAELLDKALEQNDPCFIEYKFNRSDYLDTLEEFITAYATNYSECKAGVASVYTIITPYPVDIYDSGNTEDVSSLGNLIATIQPNLMYELDPSSIPADTCIVCRTVDSIPAVAVDVIQTLQDLTDTVDTNITLTACLQGLALSDNLGTAELSATLTTCLGPRVQAAMSSNAQLISMATDQLTSVDSRIASIVSTLRDDLVLVEQSDSSIDDSLTGLSFNATEYSNTPASAFWTASGASEAFSSAIKVTGAVVNTAAKAVCGIVKTLGRGINRLWKKYVTPAIVSKDFIPSDHDTKETYCDVPCLILGDESHAVPFDMDNIAEFISNSLTESTDTTGEINFANILPHVRTSFDQDHINLTMPIMDGFGVSSESCLADGYDTSRSRSLRLVCKQKAIILGNNGLEEETTSNKLPANTHLASSSYQWVWRIDGKYSRVFMKGDAVPRKAVYRRGEFLILREKGDSVDTSGTWQSVTLKPEPGQTVAPGYAYWELTINVGSAFDNRTIGITGSKDCTAIRCKTAYGSAHMYHDGTAWNLNWDGITSSAIDFITDTGALRLAMDPHYNGGSHFTTSFVQVVDRHTGSLYVCSNTVNSTSSYHDHFNYVLDTHTDGVAVAKYVIEVPEKDWFVSADGLVITHAAGQSISLNQYSNGIKYYNGYDSKEYNSGVNMQSKHYSGASELPLPGIKFAASVRYTHKTHNDLWIDFKFNAVLTSSGITLNSLVTDRSATTYYPTEGSHIKTQWVTDTQYSYHSAPISILSKDTISALFRDASVPFDAGCACVFRKTFGVIEAFNHPGNDQIIAGTRLVAYLSPVNYRAILNGDGTLRTQYIGEQCYVDGTACDAEHLVQSFMSAMRNVSLLSGSFDYEEGDVEAYKAMYAARVLMDIYLRSVIYPQEHAYLHFSTTDGYYNFRVLTQVHPSFSKSEITRSDLINVIMRNSDLQYTPDTGSEAYKSISMLAYAVISNKPSFMKSYYYIHGVFPEFIPYIIGDRIEMPKWHIATDAEVQNYVENLVTVLIISALVIAAATIIGVAAIKAKKFLKRKINASQTLEFNQQKHVSEQIDTVNDLDDKLSALKKELGDTTDEDAIKQLQDSISSLTAQRKEAKQSLTAMQNQLLKRKKRTALWSKAASSLGVSTTPASVMTQYSHEVGLFDVIDDSPAAAEVAVDLTPVDNKLINLTQLVTSSSDNNYNELLIISDSVSDVADLVAESSSVSQSSLSTIGSSVAELAPTVLRAVKEMELELTNVNRNGPLDM